MDSAHVQLHHRHLPFSPPSTVTDAAIQAAHTTLRAMTRTLLERDDSSSTTDSSSTSTSSSSCQPGDNSARCEKPISSSSETMPIVLGAVIPIVFALAVFIILHRRHLRKQREEDANDAHKSLDFGLGPGVGPGMSRGKGMPEMTITDMGGNPIGPASGHRNRGVSMDMSTNNPYLLPAGLQSSRESIHSLSRSLSDDHDPYAPVASIRPGRSGSNLPPHDNGSMYSASTGQISHYDKANLLANAQRMPHSPLKNSSDSNSDEFPLRPQTARTVDEPNHHEVSDHHDFPPPPPPPQKEEAPLPLPPAPVHVAESMAPPPPRGASLANGPPPRKASMGSSDRGRSTMRESSNYGDVEPPMPPIPTVMEPHDAEYDVHPSMISTGYPAEELAAPQPTGQRLSVMGLRPLPPDTVLTDDNPETRANRIRSFYKEYFDDSKANPEGDYIDDYLDGGAIFDPETGGFITAAKPWAQPVGRRAMTPPPRGAPRMNAGGPHQRHGSTQSGVRSQMRGRAGSQPQMPKKRLPPPKPLHELPTPHMMGYDSAIATPIDFAPPTSFRELQNGRPASPADRLRPFSPVVRPFTPLASAYDELSAMPSPHLLRKSGTFTGLDFAPPKFRNPDGANSDAGSIRSARSGISAVQMDAVRSGAYRVSRIPKEVVTTKDDMISQLRPTMNLVRPS